MYISRKGFFFLILIFVFSANAFAGGGVDGYSGSTHSLQTFKNRLNEIQRDSSFNNSDSWYWGFYASSTHSLQTFKNRLNEIQRDGSIDSYYW